MSFEVKKLTPGHKPCICCIFEKTEGGDRIASINIYNELKKQTGSKVLWRSLFLTTDTAVGRFILLRTLIGILLNYWTTCVWATRNKIQPDVVYVSSVKAGLIARFVPLFRKSKVVQHFHGFFVGHDDISRLSYLNLVSRRNPLRYAYFAPLLLLFALLERLSFSGSSGIIVPTEYSKNLILSKCPYIDKSKIRVISNGVDKKIFYPIPRVGRPDKHRILYVGRFVPEKGVGELLQAFLLLDPKSYEVCFICPNFKNNALLGLLKDVKTSGMVIDALRDPSVIKIAGKYRNSDLCVLPSSGVFEQQPLVYFESLSCGTPVLISNNVRGVLSQQRALASDLILPTVTPRVIAHYIENYCRLSQKQKKFIGLQCIELVKSVSWTSTASKITHILLHNY